MTPECYEIRIKGSLASHWSEWFDGLQVTPDGSGETVIVGTLADQAALWGVLVKIRDLGLILCALHIIKPECDKNPNLDAPPPPAPGPTPGENKI